MPRSSNRRSLGWLGLLGVLGTSLATTGCPGSLDPALLAFSGTAGSGGGGTGGGNVVTCDNGMKTADLLANKCTESGCHNATDAPTVAAGLDLTPDATVGSRLIGVTSPGNTAAMGTCPAGEGPYLNANSSPASGLLIDKIKGTQTCGFAMPWPGVTLLTAAEQTCFEQWAEGLITAAQ